MGNRAVVALLAGTLALGARAGWAQSQMAGGDLEKCSESLGTVAVNEDRNATWYHTMVSQYKVQSLVPLLRMLIQQSNCFVVVERGAAMNNAMQERALDRSGETRQGSNFGRGQMVAADYTMNPTVSFSARDTSGIGSALSGFTNKLGSLGQAAGSVAGSLKTKEASTNLTLIDNRSTVQLAATEGNASKVDFNALAALRGTRMGSGAGGALDGYTNTPEAKVIASSFADAYNQMVKSVKNYKAQEVKGGLGKGGRLGVSQ
ncbi:MAG TPA: CsgG/HfaB family protein [Burkholderiales bacterium]|nr:CsgG/HfaB family protein [Burkholderiales bacterium]